MESLFSRTDGEIANRADRGERVGGILEPNGCLKELRIEDQLQFAGLVRVLLRTFRWPTGFGECADRAFPQPAVPQESFVSRAKIAATLSRT